MNKYILLMEILYASIIFQCQVKSKREFDSCLGTFFIIITPI